MESEGSGPPLAALTRCGESSARFVEREHARMEELQQLNIAIGNRTCLRGGRLFVGMRPRFDFKCSYFVFQELAPGCQQLDTKTLQCIFIFILNSWAVRV